MEKGITYGPENMLDEEASTMWVEGEGSAGLGKYLSFKSHRAASGHNKISQVLEPLITFTYSIGFIVLSAANHNHTPPCPVDLRTYGPV